MVGAFGTEFLDTDDADSYLVYMRFILRTATNPSFFDGRLDDTNMKDVMTEMIPFASLAPLRLRVKSKTQRREGATTQRTKIAVYAGVEYIQKPLR